MPRFTQGIFEHFGRYDRVQSCVRPQIAALHLLRAFMDIRGSGPNHLNGLFAPRIQLVFLSLSRRSCFRNVF